MRHRFFNNLIQRKGGIEDMNENHVSGMLIRPDGVNEYWFNNVNYHNVIPEELIDAVLDASKIERRNRNNEK